MILIRPAIFLYLVVIWQKIAKLNFRLHRCWWRILETKCVSENFEMLIIDWKRHQRSVTNVTLSLTSLKPIFVLEFEQNFLQRSVRKRKCESMRKRERTNCKSKGSQTYDNGADKLWENIILMINYFVITLWQYQADDLKWFLSNHWLYRCSTAVKTRSNRSPQ